MELHELKYAPGARKQRKRVGRGPASGNGKTCGKGHKGQQSRAGYSRHPGFEGGQMPLHRRLPKRGFGHQSRRPFAVVNVDTLDKFFEDGDQLTSADLVDRGLVDQTAGGVKILGRGEIAKKLTLKVEAVSPGARTKIEGAGGAVEIVAKQAAEEAPAAEAPAAKTEEAPAAEAPVEATAQETANEAALEADAAPEQDTVEE